METKIYSKAYDDFYSKLEESSKLILVDFSAEQRCAPCRSIKPVLEKIDDDFSHQIEIIKVNVDELPELATRYKIRGLPTLMIFKQGQAISSKVGALSYNALKTFVTQYI